MNDLSLENNSLEHNSTHSFGGNGTIINLQKNFSLNSTTGSANYSIPIPFAPTRNLSPEISLSYSSNNGHGAIGYGFDLHYPSIRRLTVDGVPSYDDSDRFSLSGVGELVTISDEIDAEGKRIISYETSY